MPAKSVYSLKDLIPAVHRRLGGLQRLEVKEIALSPVDATRCIYSSKYKDWNVGPKAAPIEIFINRRPTTLVWTADGEELFSGTPDAVTIDRFGQVKFAAALLATDVVHANFTWRCFSDWDVFSGVMPHAFTMVESRLPIDITPEQIQDFLFEPIILAAMIHLRRSLDSDQSLYYSYSIQEQSHQLKQVHDSLMDQIKKDEDTFSTLCDSVLWYRLQGKPRKTTSWKRPYHPSFTPDIDGSYGSLTWGMRG